MLVWRFFEASGVVIAHSFEGAGILAENCLFALESGRFY